MLPFRSASLCAAVLLTAVLGSAAALGGCREPGPTSAVEPADLRAAQLACMQENVTEGLARLDSLDAAHPASADVLAVRGMCRAVRFAADSTMADARAAHDDLSSALALTEAAPEAFQIPPAQLYNQRAFVVQSLRPDDSAAMLADLSRAVELAPLNPVYVLDRGVARAMAGDTTGARADLRRFVSLAPQESSRAAALRGMLDVPSDSALTLPPAP